MTGTNDVLHNHYPYSAMLVKARAQLSAKAYWSLGTKRKVQSASTCLIEVKRTFFKNNLINLRIIIN